MESRAEKAFSASSSEKRKKNSGGSTTGIDAGDRRPRLGSKTTTNLYDWARQIQAVAALDRFGGVAGEQGPSSSAA
jgi:hypothetical protein